MGFVVYGQQNHVKKPHENPSIGIVLCKSTNKEFVEYVIQDYQKPMGVATYKTYRFNKQSYQSIEEAAKKL